MFRGPPAADPASSGALSLPVSAHHASFPQMSSTQAGASLHSLLLLL